MKLLVFGIDAADPKVLFDHLHELPNFARLARAGSFGPLEGYCFGYGSYDNWATFYTGLPPRKHGVIRSSGVSPGCPSVADIERCDPLWRVLDRGGVSAAWVRGLMMNPPPAVRGWVLAGDPEFLRKPTSTKYPVFHEKDAHLARHLTGSIGDPARPVWLERMGATWEQALRDPSVMERVLRDDYFAEFLEFVADEADYYARNIVRLQRVEPTDFLFFYLGSMDMLQHFQMHERGWATVRRGYALLDAALGRLLDELSPENVVVASDHGAEPFHMLFPNTPREVQEEAFGWPLRTWRQDGTILCRGESGILSAAHASHGVCLLSGRAFARGVPIERRRVIDLHATVLALLGIDAASEGAPIPAFRDPDAARTARPLPAPQYRDVAVLQSLRVPQTLSVVNELWIKFRGARITVIGESRFRNTFLYDPRVDDYIEFESVGVTDASYGKPDVASLRATFPEFDLVVVPVERGGGRGVTELWI